MKFGLCKSYEHAELMEKLGFDYLEGHLGSIAKMAPEELREAKKTLGNTRLRYETCNCFFPAEVPLTGDAADLTAVRDYTKRAFENAVPLGLQLAVLGSGRSRGVPEGYDFDKAYGQMKEAFYAAGEVAKDYNVIIALEPLSKQECNILHFVGEGDDIAAELGHPNVRVLADIYHMFRNEEPYSVIPAMKTKLAHVHFSHPVTRRYPKFEDGYDYSEFAAMLRQADYNARISVEAGCDNFEQDAKDALELMKSLFA